MNQAKDIAAFVKKALTTFSISGNGYFYTIDSATGKRIPQELFFCDVVTDSVLDRLSVDLGISKPDILEMNEEPLKAYYAKYPFFRLYRNYISEWERQREFSDDLSAEEHLVAAIFGEKSQLKIEKRYDFDSVKKRLVKLLKEMDKLMPGTYHEGATINDLTIETECIISFPQITELMRSFLQMIEDVQTLFFKGIHEDLSEEEVHQFNFLCSVLIINDISAPSVYLNYENLKKYRAVYAKEGLSDFFSYVRVCKFVDTEPWRCKEFLDDEALVQQLVNCFPYVKNKLRDFYMEASKFSCRFRWSDAKQIEIEPWEMDNWSDEEYENRPLEWTRVYVQKTDAEMFDWEFYIRRLKKAASPEKKGGLAIRQYEWILKGILPHMRTIERVMVRGGNK